MEVIAHRGASYEAPENTLASFRLGWVQTTACELDIRPTSDGRILVCHDPNTRRTTGIDKSISAHTLAELQMLDAGSWKAPAYAGEKLPSLAEVLAALPAGKTLWIEIKSDAEIVPELKREVEASGKSGQVRIHAFNHSACRAAKEALPATPVFYLSLLRRDLKTGARPPTLDELLEKTRSAGLDGLSLQNDPMIDAAYVQRIHDAGLKINVWTVDKLEDAQRLRACGIDGLLTNRPGWLRAQL